MRSALPLPALAVILAALVAAPVAHAEGATCKNHYILRPVCEPIELAMRWEALPDSLQAHGRWHTATLLADGRVLVAGGGQHVSDPQTREWSIPNPIGAETYDPAAGAWQATAPMNQWRLGHHAFRLPDGRVLVVGGDEYGKPLDYRGTAEIFDPANGTWTPTGSLAVPRGGFAASLLPDGRVLVSGGVDRNDETLRSIEIYDPRTGTWAFSGRLAQQRFGHTATTLPDGRVLVVGGVTDDLFMYTTDIAEVFDPATGEWSLAGSVGSRYLHTATLTEGGEVLIAGGYESPYPTSIDDSVLFDWRAGTWSGTGHLRSARNSHLAITLRGHGVLLLGGQTWERGYPPPPVERVELFDRGRRAWLDVSTGSALLAPASSYHSATELSDGSVLFVGDLDGARAMRLQY